MRYILLHTTQWYTRWVCTHCVVYATINDSPQLLRLVLLLLSVVLMFSFLFGCHVLENYKIWKESHMSAVQSRLAGMQYMCLCFCLFDSHTGFFASISSFEWRACIYTLSLMFVRSKRNQQQRTFYLHMQIFDCDKQRRQNMLKFVHHFNSEKCFDLEKKLEKWKKCIHV